MKPIIKYVGGKHQLLPELRQLITPELVEGHVYFEPFCGGAALCLDLQPEKAILNDLNKELINLYEVASNYPQSLISRLKIMQNEHSTDYYYKIRGWDRDQEAFARMNSIAHAARFMYLNRTCFNGLWRENSKGFMNAPIGRTSNGKLPDIVQEAMIKELSAYFSDHVDLYCGNYLGVTCWANPEDVLFLDPPYYFDNKTGFTAYQKNGFTLEDTQELKKECDRLHKLGAKWVLTNDNNIAIKELFKEYKIKEVAVRRSINRDGNNRNGSEVIITNI